MLKLSTEKKKQLLDGKFVWEKLQGLHSRLKDKLRKKKNCRLNIAASAVHIKKFFDKSTKRKITELVIDIKSSFMETLRKVGWMDRKTKKHALAKAEKMSSFIGYPEELLDDGKVEEYYHEVINYLLINILYLQIFVIAGFKS